MSMSSIFEYNYANRNKKTIVNIVKSSVKQYKTYWSKLWIGSSDAYLILALVSCVSNEYLTRIKRVAMRISLIRIWYSQIAWGAIAPHAICEYQVRIRRCNFDTHLIRIWYSSDTSAGIRNSIRVSDAYQMSIRWVSDEYQMFCYTECMECMILMILQTYANTSDTHYIHMVAYGTHVCRIFGFV